MQKHFRLFFTFDISVKLHFAVQVVQALEDLPENDLDVALLELAGLHQVQGRTATQVLHDDP